MDIFTTLRNDIIEIITRLHPSIKSTNQIAVETPKDPLNGDLSTNAAMVISKELGRSPRDIAMELKVKLQQLSYISHIDVAGPGFINFTIHALTWQKEIDVIINAGILYGKSNIGLGQRVNVEYVSANPTGPMHIGHARGAVYGDTLARLLQFCSYDVTKEYYINDAGAQIDTLAHSAFLRYKEAATGEEVEIPTGFYPGEYLKPVGESLALKYGAALLSQNIDEAILTIKDFVVNEMLSIIKKDLLELGIEHNVFTSEDILYKEKKIDIALEKLKSLDLIYEGTLPPPKGKPSDDWEAVELLLFKSTKFGDDQDRPVKKSNGKWAYIAGDIAYSYDKITRGFNSVIIVLGADHAGYVKRIKAAIQAISENKVTSDVILCQLVNYVENGEPVKMSKRAGNFTTVRDVVQELSKDIVRFMMLTRKNDTILDFDLVVAKEQSKENPVFYVQYAYVRTNSIMNGIKNQMPQSYKIFDDKEYDLSLLSTEAEINLIKLLASWPNLVISSATHFEAHRIAFYLQSVASVFHSLWNLGKENNQYRFILENDIQLTASRCALVKAVHDTMASGFHIIGIETLERM